MPIISISIVILFALLSFSHKMAGIEMLIIYQIIYNVFMMDDQFSDYYSMFHYYTYANMNFLFFFNQQSNNYDVDSMIIPYNQDNK